MGIQLSISSFPPSGREIIQRASSTHTLSLDLKNQSIETWPSRFQLRRIQHLYLGHNRLRDFPRGFGNRWGQLLTLDLSFNKISIIPHELKYLSNLRALDVKGNLLSNPKNVPSGNLRQLNLFNNLIQQFPSLVWELTALEDLILDYNLIDTVSHSAQISTVSDAFLVLTRLVSLRMSQNLIKQFLLPITEIAPNLRILDLSLNCLTELFGFSHSHGHEAGCLYPENLQVLCLFQNQLSTIPDFSPTMTSLIIVNLYSNQLYSVSPTFGYLHGLIDLNLSENFIRSIPTEFSSLTALQHLNISKNLVDSLPLQLSGLQSLTKLVAYDNNISGIPESVYSLGSLKYLNLSSNKISHVPNNSHEDAPLLFSLEELYLSENSLDTIPLSFVGFKHIQSLGLSYNRISTLPEDFTKLSTLKYLFLSGNQIQALSFELRDLPHLKWLYINNNNMRSIPQSIKDYACEVKDISGNQVVSINPGNLTPVDESKSGRRRSKGFRGVSVNQSRRFRVSNSEMIGRRPHMEDAVCLRGCYRNRPTEDLFAVFDGHGTEGNGKKAAEYLSMYFYEDLENALVEALKPFMSTKSHSLHKADSGLLVDSTDDDNPIKNVVAMRSSAAEGKDLRALSGHRNLGQLNVSVGDSGAPSVSEEDDIPIERSVEIDVISKVLVSTFEKTNETMLEQTKKIGAALGSTGAVAYIRRNLIFSANCGDSRIVLCRSGKALQLSIDHKPFLREEEKRIREVGGYVTETGRVNGQLAVARSFGDAKNRPAIAATPYVNAIEFDPATDPFLVIACDGVFDVMSNQDVVDCVLQEMEVDPTFTTAANRVRDMAYQYGSADNISVIVVGFLGA